MSIRITSLIDITTEGNQMDNDNKHKKKHHYQSKAVSDKNRLFHNVTRDDKGVKQDVTVTVNVNPEPSDDCLTSFFKCFGTICGK